MEFAVPDDVGASLPHQFVEYLGDSEIASIAPTPRLPEQLLTVSAHDGVLYWSLGAETLCVKLASIGGAHLAHSTFMDTQFAVFVLQFGFGDDSGGGVILLNSHENTLWLRDFSEKIAPLIPGGVTDELD